jgi:shikimate kinase
MTTHQNIFLIGMPGSGKSTVGKALSKLMQMPFVDTDEEIVKRNGVAITTIFEIEGETGFRLRETAVIAELTKLTNIILATGGGAILNAENRANLRANGVVVYLNADIDVLVQRTTQDKGKRNKRPLLDVTNVHARLHDLLLVRQPLYVETAHITVDANHTNRAKFIQHLIETIAAHNAVKLNKILASNI